jgi:carbon storage regulator
MLILTRKIGEALVIDKEITVTVMGIKGTQIRIGVDAPRDIKVNREEIHNRIAKEQEQKD